MNKWRQSAFSHGDEDPLGPLANLVDIILVFACGLIAALVKLSPDLQQRFQQTPTRDIELGRELPTAPKQLQKQMQTGPGFEPVGQVYRDPKTGKLILIDQN